MVTTYTVNKNLIWSVAVLAMALAISYAIIVQAVSKDDIVYPVAELGNCKDETACKTYCDQVDNYSACFAFAKKHNLLEGPLVDKSEQELEQFAQALKGGGPGGCQDQRSCDAFCSNIDNMNVCLAFAEEHNLMPVRELEEAKKVQQALARGAKLPGGCKNKQECEAYCSSESGNMDECLAFAEAAGFIPPEELAQARQAMKFMKRGETPGGCRSKQACESYCENDNNFQECIAFAEKAGFISGEELKMAKKTGGRGPGGCRGRACENFCEVEKNFPTCLAFAEEHGLIKPEEAAMARKTGGKGPGGCKGREQCETFCQNPANQEACFNFAQEHDLLSAEDKQRIEEGKQQMMQGLSQAPPEVAECLKSQLGSDFAEKVQSGNFMPGPAVGDKMRQCFEQFMPRGGDGEMMDMPGDFSGPGGCQTPEECQVFCQNNPDECANFGPGHDGQPGEFPVGDFPREMTPEQFQGQPPSPEMMQQYQEQYQQQYEQQMHDALPEGESLPTSPEMMPMMESAPTTEQMQQMQQQYQEQYQQQYQEQFQQQVEQQYQEQYEQQSQEQFQQQSEQQYQEQYQQQYEQQYQQQYEQQDQQQYEQYQEPTSGDSYTPPSSEPPPATSAPTRSFLGTVLDAFLNLAR